VGYVVEGAGTTYFAGDTSLFPGMAEIDPGIDVALLPVWGWGPNLRGEHLDPEDAARCLPLIAPEVAVPIHYGTFWPRGMSRVRPRVFHEPGREFAEHAKELAPDVEVRVLEVGTSTVVTLPTARAAG
jgi:L-ascorbate metabolism protein UlaG (beta-lactamase superfamily)